MKTRLTLLLLLCCAAVAFSGEQLANVNDVPADLTIPALADGAPAAGKRVKQTLPGWQDSAVHHVLYLPPDWVAGKKFPLLIEYPGNGGYTNKLGDVSTGRVEDCKLGYGISGGTGMIWAVLPFVDPKTRTNQANWWGDPDATADYCVQAVRFFCEHYNADPDTVILTGFSRGSIACSYIGLRNDTIAKLWRSIIAHSHYDGVRKWPHTDSDAASALARLQRFAGRPQFISHEGSADGARAFLDKHGLAKPCRFVSLPFPNHTDVWVLRDLPARKELREWLADVLKQR